jgi:hypothetical protein
MIFTTRSLKNIVFALPIMAGVAHAEIPDTVERYPSFGFACLPVGRLAAYNDQFDVRARDNRSVEGPGFFNGFIWTGPNSAPAGTWGTSDYWKAEGEKSIERALETYLPKSKFPGVGSSQSIVVGKLDYYDNNTVGVRAIGVLDNQLLIGNQITSNSPSGTATVAYPQISRMETFRCSPNRGTNTFDRGWVERILLDLEPKNWRPSLLAAIQEDPTFSVFSEMVTKAGLNDYFNSLDAYDGLILPSNVGIRRQFEKQIRNGLPSREIEPSALRAMVDRKVSELLDTDSQKLQEIVLAQVVKNGYDLGAGSGQYKDGNGASVSIGRGSPSDFGVNNGLTINGDRNCDVDFRPIQTKQGIIYPSLCLRAVK